MKQMMGPEAHLSAVPRKTPNEELIGVWLSAIGYARSASAIGYRLSAIFSYGALYR